MGSNPAAPTNNHNQCIKRVGYNWWSGLFSFGNAFLEMLNGFLPVYGVGFGPKMVVVADIRPNQNRP